MDQTGDAQAVSAEPSRLLGLVGAVASLGLTLVLLSSGAGMGFSMILPWANSGLSATSLKIEAIPYFIVMAMISSSVRGRLRTKWVGIQEP